MTTKDTVLQEAINMLINKRKHHAIDIEVFNYYFRKFGVAKGNIFLMAAKAAEMMEAAYQERAYEYEKQQQISSAIEM